MTLADLSISNYLVPTVVEQTNRGERAFDLYSRLLKENIIYFYTPNELREKYGEVENINNKISAKLKDLK